MYLNKLLISITIFKNNAIIICKIKLLDKIQKQKHYDEDII